MPNRPNFIIAGAPRSGTTWLANYLNNTPNVFFPQPLLPEPKIFNSPQLRESGQYAHAYQELYKDAPLDSLKGEKTSGYLEDPSCVPLIRDFFPRIKLVFLLRHPAERAYSNYLFTKKNGYEDRSFDEAWKLSSDSRPNPLQETMPHLRLYDYLSRSEYAKLLKPFLKVFAPSEMCIVLYERLIGEADETIQQLSDFLEHPLASPSKKELEAVNSARNPRGPALPTKTSAAIMAHLKDDLAELYSFFPLAKQYWQH